MYSSRLKTMRLVVMISGGGTNLQAIMDAIQGRQLKAQIAAVVSNRKNAYGLVRAKEANIPTEYFPLKPYKDAGKSREQYDADLAARIASFQPDLIVLAGWMHILSPAFLDHFPKRVINLHPALPGQFSGTQAIERAYEASRTEGLRYSGVMVHYAIPEVDAGAVIVSAKVPILRDDTLETFEKRMHMTEHNIIVQAIAWVCETIG